ncbi:neuroglobin-like [Condylostylus longicornis]|uniref:neuroglobin-like n=1 Tax=Condylostylus longicornis TaxID=2530218 RepID=UPI00244D9FE9|nr:neuroglobin-like [Condylostylus longicornis]XP_055390358.1 neuroglobin-like [Condylostylus longicornis]XP_055390359.1 neuroglobin-like [Condylostylus longicornis]
MGCELSKIGSNNKDDKNIEDEKLSEPPAPAAPDPRLPLTAKQKYNLLASWRGISRATQLTGINMFVKLFEEHSYLLEIFKFKELRTREEQARSEELAEHANKVMSTLDEGIRGLDDLDTFFIYLHQIGSSHRRIQGFKSEYFWKVEKPFLSAVENTLGDRYTANVEGIYKITIKFIIETLINGYENANSANYNTQNTDIPEIKTQTNGNNDSELRSPD